MQKTVYELVNTYADIENGIVFTDRGDIRNRRKRQEEEHDFEMKWRKEGKHIHVDRTVYGASKRCPNRHLPPFQSKMPTLI